MGPLILSKNSELTDLSALYIAEVLSKVGTYHSHITKLKLSHTKMMDKAGLFIGEALLNNPSYPLHKLEFKGVNLEESGLHRILEAINANKHLSQVHLGLVSDYGLQTMSELLASNTSLLKLEFSESKLTLIIIKMFK
jgi:hypothetical protein